MANFAVIASLMTSRWFCKLGFLQRLHVQGQGRIWKWNDLTCIETNLKKPSEFVKATSSSFKLSKENSHICIYLEMMQCDEIWSMPDGFKWKGKNYTISWQTIPRHILNYTNFCRKPWALIMAYETAVLLIWIVLSSQVVTLKFKKFSPLGWTGFYS